MQRFEYSDIATHNDKTVYVISYNKENNIVAYVDSTNNGNKIDFKFDSVDKFKRIAKRDLPESEFWMHKANFDAIMEQAELELLEKTTKTLLLSEYRSVRTRVDSYISKL